MEPTRSNNEEALFTRKRFYLLGNFVTFQVSTRVQGRVLVRATRKLIFDYTAIIVVSWKSRFKTLNLNASGTKKDVAPKQR